VTNVAGSEKNHLASAMIFIDRVKSSAASKGKAHRLTSVKILRRTAVGSFDHSGRGR